MGMFGDDTNNFDTDNIVLLVLKYVFLGLISILTLGIPIIIKIVKDKNNKSS